MTRESTEALLQANGKTMADCTGECEVEVGRKLGADCIISGRITQIGSSQILTMRLFSTADGALMGDEEASGKSQDQLLEAAKEAIARLVAPLAASAAKRSSSAASAGAGSEGHIGGAAQEVAIGGEADVVVQFVSEPPGAVVMLDGALLCQATPCSKLVAKGAHEVSLQREGYEPQSEQVIAKEGAKVQLALARIAARVSVETEPTSIAVSIDSKAAGASPLSWRELPAGAHEVVIDDPCWQREGERVVLKKGEDRPLHLAGNPRLAGLKLTAEDEQGNALEGRALLDGKELGKVPGTFKLPLCSKSVEVATSDGSQSVELQLEEGKVAQKRSVLHKRAEPTAPSQRKVAGVQSPAAAPAPGGAGVLAALFAAAAAKGRYDTTTAGVVIDRVTKLMWQQPAEAKEYNWSDADAYCASLALAGHAGWHLPTKDELLSLVDKSHRPTIDPTAFPDTPSDYLLWSSSPVAAVAGYAWVVDFISGGSNGDVTSNSYSVRCVH